MEPARSSRTRHHCAPAPAGEIPRRAVTRPSLAAPLALAALIALATQAPAAVASSGADGVAPDDSADARTARFETLLAFRDLVAGGTVEPHWLGDGASFWYSPGDGSAAVRVDAATGARTALAPEELPAPAPGVTDSVAATAGELPAPDGRWSAVVDGGDLWLRSAEDGRLERLTRGGSAEDGWNLDGALWSADGYRLALQRVDLRGVHELPVVHWLGPEEEVEWQPYPFVGGHLPQSTLYVVDVLEKRPVRVDTGSELDQQLHLLGWRGSTGELLFLRLDRAMKRLDLMAADPRTGAAHTLLTESRDTFFEGLRFWEVADDFYTPLSDGRFLWRSERGGWSDLFLYDRDGHLQRRLTDSQLLAERVVSVDEAAGWVYFLGQGGDAHPYDRHLYRVSLAGEGLTRLTAAPGVHDVVISPSHQVFVDNHSAPDRPPRAELRRIDGGLVTELERADVSALDALGWRPPEEVTAKAADGETDLYGVLYKPIDFDPARRYPLVEVIYGGPQGSIVPRGFVPGDTCHFAQALAQLGFVTAILDARGTPGRGKAFQDVVYRGIGRHEIPDHVAMLRQLAASRPYVDLARVGIWGKSWGGYFALRGMLLAPDFYRVGVAWAPVAELESVEQASVEPYMERPRDNPEGYAYASNLTRAAELRGNLLMIIGTADRNTPFSHTMRMVEALVRADRPVDLLVLPEQDHWPQGASRRYLFAAVRRYFVDHLGTDLRPPQGAAEGAAEGAVRPTAEPSRGASGNR